MKLPSLCHLPIFLGLSACLLAACTATDTRQRPNEPTDIHQSLGTFAAKTRGYITEVHDETGSLTLKLSPDGQRVSVHGSIHYAMKRSYGTRKVVAEFEADIPRALLAERTCVLQVRGNFEETDLYVPGRVNHFTRQPSAKYFADQAIITRFLVEKGPVWEFNASGRHTDEDTLAIFGWFD